MQFFKGDAQERKFEAAGSGILTQLSAQKSIFFDEAYACFVLGELLFDSGRAPLSNAIPRAIFRESFVTIFEAFISAGNFEGYLTVFRNIFGEDVEVEFTVPAPGKLNIEITAAGFVLSDFIARHVVANAYVFDEVVNEDVDNIAFQTVKGFQSQYDLEQMLFEMVPAGIYTEITLSVG